MPSIQLAASSTAAISLIVRPANEAADASAIPRFEISPALKARSNPPKVSACPQCSASSDATVVRRRSVPSRSNTTTG